MIVDNRPWNLTGYTWNGFKGLYWNFLDTVVPGVAGGGPGGGGAVNASMISVQSQNNQLFEDRAVAVYIEMVAPMLSEDKKKLYRLANVNISKGERKIIAEDVKVIVESVEFKQKLKEVYNTEDIKDVKPAVDLEGYRSKIRELIAKSKKNNK